MTLFPMASSDCTFSLIRPTGRSEQSPTGRVLQHLRAESQGAALAVIHSTLLSFLTRFRALAGPFPPFHESLTWID